MHEVVRDLRFVRAGEVEEEESSRVGQQGYSIGLMIDVVKGANHSCRAELNQ
jgi:hypothetical protein